MRSATLEPQEIYLHKMKEVSKRLGACEVFLSEYNRTKSVYFLEAVILQLRKALESISFAAIAPNKNAYEKFRLEAEKPADYRKDYNGRKILQLLRAINKDFYPKPLLPPTKGGGKWNFERKSDGFLTEKKFKSIYDRLGKYLHSDNPWGDNKGINNLVAAIPALLSEIHALIEIHFTVIRTPEFSGVWVVNVPKNGDHPKIICGKAEGDFVVK